MSACRGSPQQSSRRGQSTGVAPVRRIRVSKIVGAIGLSKRAALPGRGARTWFRAVFQQPDRVPWRRQLRAMPGKLHFFDSSSGHRL
ncbi:MAG: hypothetical protein HY066_17075 [Betaproteobacteria bacterium]|nr:hypothetical protein [Betaproteobacteria bacterium]